MSKQFNRGCMMKAILILIMAFVSINPAAGKGKPMPPPPDNTQPTPMQIFGAWHCGNHYYDWSEIRDMQEFDDANHWLIDRGDDWDAVLADDPAQLGYNAAAIAQKLDVGIEIDYENSSSPNIPTLQWTASRNMSRPFRRSLRRNSPADFT